MAMLPEAGCAGVDVDAGFDAGVNAGVNAAVNKERDVDRLQNSGWQCTNAACPFFTAVPSCPSSTPDTFPEFATSQPGAQRAAHRGNSSLLLL